MTSISLLPSITTITSFPRHSLFPLKPISYPSKSIICFSSPTSSSNGDREEIRWLREEQRWLREEQRWLREEQRWLSERDSLFRDISALKLKIQALENQGSVSDVSFSESISNVTGMLQILKEKNLIADSGSSSRPIELGEDIEVEEKEKRVVAEEVVTAMEVAEKKEEKKRETLRIGSEGEDVRVLQEQLLKLGFYSGEEDMEFSCFSTDTERAVKTWQATLGVREDGVMSPELLERLYTECLIESSGSGLNIHTSQKSGSLTTQKDGANGAVVASITKKAEIHRKVVKDDATQHRVFLLGENRWEEPSRLGKYKNVVGSKAEYTSTNCYACNGFGRILCSECDGSGEPNIEPQFYELLEEEEGAAKCPYCEGSGFSVCDECAGKMVA